ncbi:calcium-binding protein [Rhodovulum sp. DZ06]|uniref:calcium-binding protein n=1 Tax=Rhodovulum sp. DZ06 TaxID=3425126 RepID=UPI003D34EFF4
MSRSVPAVYAALSETVSASSPAIVGGAGRQYLRGGDGDDFIYADRETAGTLMRVADGVRSAEFGALSAPTLAAAAEIDGHVVFYGADATLGRGGVAGWEVDGSGALLGVWSQSANYYYEPVLTGARAVHALRHDGAAWLVTGGWGVSLSRIDDAGRPRLVDTAYAMGGDGLARPGAFASWSEGSDLHLLIGGWDEDGLTHYLWDGAALSLQERIEDSVETRLSDVAAIETVSLDGRFVLTLSSRDGGLTVWRREAGGLVEVDGRSFADDETGFDLAGATSMAVIEQVGQALVYAATDRGMLVAYRLSADGQLTRLYERGDISHVAQLRIGAADFLAVSDGSDRVRLMEIGAGGALSEYGAVSLGEDALTGALEAVEMGGSALLMVARPDEGGFDLVEFARDGDDLVYAGKGADTVRGGGGADRIFGQGGADTLWGEDGDDLLLGGADDDVLDGGDGDDELRGGADHDVLTGGLGNDHLKGGNGRDVIDGGEGNDILRGGMLADRIDGGAGRDLIRAGYGHDTAWGGEDDDEIYGQQGFDNLFGGGGNDWIGGGNGDDQIWGDGGDDVLLGALGDDVIEGGLGNDEIRGGGHKDTLYGNGGDDFLFGDEGADHLDGGWASDYLDGGRGPDTLIGGAGNDILVGGGGADVFRFGGPFGRDVILDFDQKGDLIAFDGGPAGMGQLVIENGAQGAVVHMGDPLINSITLVGVAAEDLSRADFLFE